MLGWLMAAILGGMWGFFSYALWPALYPAERVILLDFVGLGLGLGSLMSGILFGVEVTDPLTMVAVMSGIGVTALMASLAPLRHAVRVSPAETLRSE